MNKSIVAIVLSAFMFTACSGMTVVGYDRGDGKFVVQRDISTAHAFTPTIQRSWIEVCNVRVDSNTYNECTPSGPTEYAVENGYLDGIGGAALQAGAIVGAGAFIGAGLAKSGRGNSGSGGNTVVNSGSSTSTSTATATATLTD